MTIRSLALAGAVLAGTIISSELLATNRNSSTVPPLFAVLLGGNEISPTGEADAGDKDGRGSATVIIDGPKLCFGIVVEDIDTPILAHIHRGVAGVNGPIVVDLVPGAAVNSAAFGAGVGEVDATARALQDEIRATGERSEAGGVAKKGASLAAATHTLEGADGADAGLARSALLGPTGLALLTSVSANLTDTDAGIQQRGGRTGIDARCARFSFARNDGFSSLRT